MVMGLQGPGSLVVTGSSFSLLHISYLLWELGGLPPGMGYWATGAMGYWATGLDHWPGTLTTGMGNLICPLGWTAALDKGTGQKHTPNLLRSLLF